MTDTTADYSQMPEKNKQKGFRKILNPFFAMLLIFGLPYAFAWYFIYSGDSVDFEAPNNNGLLVSPVIPLGEFSFTKSDGTGFKHTDLAGNWTLFTVTSGCERACQETLFTIRQIRSAMGVNRKVIKPIVLLQTPEALSELPVDLTKEFPQLSIVNLQGNSHKTIIEPFSHVTSEIENSIFMVDPFGNLMMVYPAGSDQRGMMDDLKRLLKVNVPNI